MVSQSTLLIPVIVTINDIEPYVPLWVLCLIAMIAVVALLIMVAKAFIAGDWDLDLYVPLMNTTEVSGNNCDSGVLGASHMDLQYDRDRAHKFMTNQGRVITPGNSLENSGSEPLLEKYGSLNDSIFLVVDISSAMICADTVITLERAIHDVQDTTDYERLLEVTVTNCRIITKAMVSKGVDVSTIVK